MQSLIYTNHAMYRSSRILSGREKLVHARALAATDCTPPAHTRTPNDGEDALLPTFQRCGHYTRKLVE
jgi:hypothetical protein